jgi:hypothetical protein
MKVERSEKEIKNVRKKYDNYSAKGVSPQTFPAPDVHDVVSRIFMGMEIDNKKWSKLLLSWNSISTPGFQKQWPS